MSVQRFRSFEDAERALWRKPFDAENLRILCSISTTLRLLGGWTLPKGVFKYTSIEEADGAWEDVVRKRVAVIRARMKPTDVR